MKLSTTFASIVSLLVLLMSPVNAGDFDLGIAAYDAAEWDQALEEFQPLAESGDAIAQFYLGTMYAHGRGVEPDSVLAVSWYQRAAEQGLAVAQYNLGTHLEDGLGVEQDLSLAFNWYLKAANQGYLDAQFNIAGMYMNGSGVVQDDSKSVEWLRLAAAQGDASAQYNLGYMIANGRGVQSDFVTAYMWFNISSSGGIGQANAVLEQLSDMMTSEELAEARQRTFDCTVSELKNCGTVAEPNTQAAQTYKSPEFGWSITVPEGWTLDAEDPSFLRILPPTRNGLCGVQTGDVQFASSTELAEFLQDFTAKELEQQGLVVRETSKEEVLAPSGELGIRIITELEPGGRSVKVYYVVDGKGIIIDCETSVAVWNTLSEAFEGIQNSFRFD